MRPAKVSLMAFVSAVSSQAEPGTDTHTMSSRSYLEPPFGDTIRNLLQCHQAPLLSNSSGLMGSSQQASGGGGKNVHAAEVWGAPEVMGQGYSPDTAVGAPYCQTTMETVTLTPLPQGRSGPSLRSPVGKEGVPCTSPPFAFVHTIYCPQTTMNLSEPLSGHLSGSFWAFKPPPV